jgi:hypothetical protein
MDHDESFLGHLPSSKCYTTSYSGVEKIFILGTGILYCEFLSGLTLRFFVVQSSEFQSEQ